MIIFLYFRANIKQVSMQIFYKINYSAFQLELSNQLDLFLCFDSSSVSEETCNMTLVHDAGHKVRIFIN